MTTRSQLIEIVENGAVLDINIEEHTVRAYVVISAPDVDAVADIVPEERFEHAGDIHVMAVAHPDDAAAIVGDALFNVSPDDTVVFLCHDAGTKDAVLHEFLGADGLKKLLN
ncbi:hypothetical protein L1889_05710 [Paenalcaligenes niemegkensis]|uniref:hypothetical protein n=1 Tax=Paenalcaligenes niemegkensis TaxID=2895469 RepID=UPI001EE87E6B|nr:hypothetical protein [Paenalcaligenes niemegkensis]MCQ9616259.1 hypothetical protein [Paenalcaligenes niemegkensis]